ncbi:hypothetical protein CVT25_013155 [Psilocybe cyanescens]|uniref:Uncharacterized protein n=1 Tax=Psilocybe cyanescens TaxID=93625 RepID=A0A409XK39_PSICY|nr:hypothetical protein CVT25_013155 [Psilocybe cyanescens]
MHACARESVSPTASFASTSISSSRSNTEITNPPRLTNQPTSKPKPKPKPKIKDRKKTDREQTPSAPEQPKALTTPSPGDTAVDENTLVEVSDNVDNDTDDDVELDELADELELELEEELTLALLELSLLELIELTLELEDDGIDEEIEDEETEGVEEGGGVTIGGSDTADKGERESVDVSDGALEAEEEEDEPGVEGVADGVLAGGGVDAGVSPGALVAIVIALFQAKQERRRKGKEKEEKVVKSSWWSKDGKDVNWERSVQTPTRPSLQKRSRKADPYPGYPDRSATTPSILPPTKGQKGIKQVEMNAGTLPEKAIDAARLFIYEVLHPPANANYASLAFKPGLASVELGSMHDVEEGERRRNVDSPADIMVEWWF